MSKAFRMDLATNVMFPSVPIEALVLQALPLSLFCSLSSLVVLTFGARDLFIMGPPVHFMMFTGIPYLYTASQVAQLVKNQCRSHRRHGFDLWFRKIPWRRKWQPTPVFLPGKFHGQRNLVAIVSGVTESDMISTYACIHVHTRTLTSVH